MTARAPYRVHCDCLRLQRRALAWSPEWSVEKADAATGAVDRTAAGYRWCTADKYCPGFLQPYSASVRGSRKGEHTDWRSAPNSPGALPASAVDRIAPSGCYRLPTMHCCRRWKTAVFSECPGTDHCFRVNGSLLRISAAGSRCCDTCGSDRARPGAIPTS